MLGYEREIIQFIKRLKSSHEVDLLACTLSAYKAGNRIAKRDFSQKLEVKTDEHVGHHASITEADLIAQQMILEETGKYLPNALFIGEETDITDPRFSKFVSRILTESNYLELLPHHKVEISDSLDGTAQYDRRTGLWSVSVGIADKMKHTAAAVYGPRCNYHETGSGLLAFAAEDTPTFMMTNNGVEKAKVSSTPVDRKEWFVHYGADTPFLSPEGFSREYVGKSWTGNMPGSSALGLALVATGDSHASYQPEQRVWDWAAGKLLVERAGGHVLMYEIGKKLREMEMETAFDIMRVDKLKPYHYNPGKKPCGFVAACSREVAETVFAELEQAYAAIRK